MHWKRFKPRSLRAQLMALLMPAVVVVAGVELALTRYVALDAANAAYDRSLLGAMRSLNANISFASGGMSIEQPYTLFEFFEMTASGRVYFRLATFNGLVEIGSAGLPLPTGPLYENKPSFYDATYFGETLRVGSLLRRIEDPRAHNVGELMIVQVAENTESREAFTASFIRRAAVRDAILLAAVILALALIARWATARVSRLSNEVKARRPADVAPIDTEGLPTEVSLLVQAINTQMARTHDLLTQQRSFVDDASHQLRTPLATLRAQLDYALLIRDPAKLQDTLQALVKQVDYATRNTNQLLALARSDTAQLHPAPFDMGELLRDVAVSLLPLARSRGIDLGVDADTPVAMVGDAGLLREALSNLADNAIRHAPVGSEVTLSGAKRDHEYALWVVDDGPGLPPAVLARAGERFVPGPQQGSVGLGLAIVHAIAERHHGKLTIAQRTPTGLCMGLAWPEALATDAPVHTSI
ncbi:sensor histidine kinase [Pigmentiphaga aceris]|uniref:histidine kinase n=1 Tax=Pigmentiphaga aceris TaxID=1940612 RepID=A0A5C0B1W5_9BURK|nr:sensor histidine kinase [Pigmentiphaga aceris]QEI07936.1 sensor histidine kinase [Pigmentiphaga aceris]